MMAEFQARHEEAVRQHEATLAAAQKQYERSIAQATSDFKSILAESEALKVETQNQPDSAPTATIPSPATEEIPAAAWINAPDGEKMMVLNKQAAIMFLAIFSKLEEVAKELEKLTPKKRR